MSLAAALTYFNDTITWPSGWTMAGLDQPDFIPDALIPYCYVQFSGTGGEGLRALDVQLENGLAVVHINHVVTLGGPADRQVHGGVAGIIDSYFDALVGELLLDDNLVEPLSVVGVTENVETHSGLLMALIFRHRWAWSIS